jgi:hypothetical protein
MNIANIVDKINEKLDSLNFPANTLPATILWCISNRRAGLSAYKTASKVIENNKILGIPADPNPDGSENMINQYTYNLVKCVFDAIKNDAVVSVAIPRNSLMIQGTGGNAGGPVTTIGFNLLDSISKGIVQ